MPVLSYITVLSSIVLELTLLFRLLVVTKRWKTYLWLFLYVSYTLLVMDLAMLGIYWLKPNLYRRAYWEAETISMSLRFLIIWEIFRQIFREVPVLRSAVSKGLALIALAPIIFSIYAFWKLSAPARLLYAYVAMERSFDLVQAVLVIGVLLAARYYRLTLTRNTWGISLGFGAYVSVSTMIFAAVSMRESLVAYMQILGPLSFVAMLAIWTWSLWLYEPNPPLSVATSDLRGAALDWRKEWGRMLTTVKRLRNP